MKRRKFIKESSNLICACAFGSAFTMIQSCTKNISDSESGSEDETISDNSNQLVLDLKDSNYSILQNNGGSLVIGASSIDNRGILLLRYGNDIKAFSNNCTHAGYGMRPFVNGVSICTSGHGGSFNTSGRAVSDPASGSLQQYSTQLIDDTLTIFG